MLVFMNVGAVFRVEHREPVVVEDLDLEDAFAWTERYLGIRLFQPLAEPAAAREGVVVRIPGKPHLRRKGVGHRYAFEVRDHLFYVFAMGWVICFYVGFEAGLFRDADDM